MMHYCCFYYQEKPVATLSRDVQHDANIDVRLIHKFFSCNCFYVHFVLQTQKRSFIDPEKHYELDEVSYSRITEVCTNECLACMLYNFIVICFIFVRTIQNLITH